MKKVYTNKNVVFAGIISGSFLGLFLKIIEGLTGVKVYILLLNLDYVPYLNQFEIPELVEFLIHLGISVVVSIVFMFTLNKLAIVPEKTIYASILASITIGILLFPTTALSERTPELIDILAWFYWLLGHAGFGGLLGYLLKREQ